MSPRSVLSLILGFIPLICLYLPLPSCLGAAVSVTRKKEKEQDGGEVDPTGATDAAAHDIDADGIVQDSSLVELDKLDVSGRRGAAEDTMEMTHMVMEKGKEVF